ncbi:hypothetical protein MNV84_00992 [Leishmania braziliensis]|nr:hypothetical protein MNV84_00992 [Leishmania braziliensis]
MEGARQCGATRLPKRLLAALFAVTVLLEALDDTLPVAQAVVETPAPTPYVRRTYEAKVSFFTKYWWVGFIMMFVAFLLVVGALYVAVQFHFKESEQRDRRKELEMNRFSIENCRGGEEVGGPEADQQGRSGQSLRNNPLRSRG